ncbi:MAG: tripartite tricarboxylate transporter TctB family protein [Lentisphaerae bacterium]|nr:tripartite tricarboxylate transporter TctB family protein [Lentisphaerota bacterium]
MTARGAVRLLPQAALLVAAVAMAAMAWRFPRDIGEHAGAGAFPFALCAALAVLVAARAVQKAGEDVGGAAAGVAPGPPRVADGMSAAAGVEPGPPRVVDGMSGTAGVEPGPPAAVDGISGTAGVAPGPPGAADGTSGTAGVEPGPPGAADGMSGTAGVEPGPPGAVDGMSGTAGVEPGPPGAVSGTSGTAGGAWRLPVLCVAYMAVLPWLGFMSSTALFTAAMLGAMGYRRVGRALAFGLALAIVLHWVFAVWMQVPLPEGWLG